MSKIEELQENNKQDIFIYQQNVFRLVQDSGIITNDDVHPTEIIDDLFKTFFNLDKQIKNKHHYSIPTFLQLASLLFQLDLVATFFIKNRDCFNFDEKKEENDDNCNKYLTKKFKTSHRSLLQKLGTIIEKDFSGNIISWETFYDTVVIASNITVEMFQSSFLPSNVLIPVDVIKIILSYDVIEDDRMLEGFNNFSATLPIEPLIYSRLEKLC